MEERHRPLLGPAFIDVCGINGALAGSNSGNVNADARRMAVDVLAVTALSQQALVVGNRRYTRPHDGHQRLRCFRRKSV